jgi:hypothetical protein
MLAMTFPPEPYPRFHTRSLLHPDNRNCIGLSILSVDRRPQTCERVSPLIVRPTLHLPLQIPISPSSVYDRLNWLLRLRSKARTRRRRTDSPLSHIYLVDWSAFNAHSPLVCRGRQDMRYAPREIVAGSFPPMTSACTEKCSRGRISSSPVVNEKMSESAPSR